MSHERIYINITHGNLVFIYSIHHTREKLENCTSKLGCNDARENSKNKAIYSCLLKRKSSKRRK